MLIDVAEKYSQRMLGAVVHELWDLKLEGVAAEEIALRIGWSVSAVRRHLRAHGGVRPRWGRNLEGRSLSMAERETILELKGTQGIREIARQLGRSPSTISRELNRHTQYGVYRATTAHARDNGPRARVRAGQTPEGS